MLRKTILTLATAAAMGAAALAPSTADAARHGGFHARGGHAHAARVHVARVYHRAPVARVYHRARVRHVHYVRHFRHPVRVVRHRPYVVRYVRPVRYACVVRRVVATPYGPRVRLVNRCRPYVYRVRVY